MFEAVNTDPRYHSHTRLEALVDKAQDHLEISHDQPLVATTTNPMDVTKQRDEEKLRDARFAIRLSLIVGLVMLVGKITAYLITHSVAIFSDAAESVVHVVAVAFPALSLRWARHAIDISSRNTERVSRLLSLARRPTD
jgi:Co/Zn/Cd efflux system component